MTKSLYGVFGRPIKHSRSPFIHHQFAKELEIDLEYRAILVEDDLKKAIEDFRDAGGMGANITLPFKQEIFHLADIAHAPALKANSANTLWWGGDEGLIVTNTDGVGLVRDLTINLEFSLANKDILIIGAGGACAGVIAPIFEAKPALIHIANRTKLRAEKIVENVYQANRELWEDSTNLEKRVEIKAIDINSLSRQNDKNIGEYDLIINATSAGLSDSGVEEFINLSSKIAKSKTLAYDMLYGMKTPFYHWATKNNINYCSGVGMLVEQAAEAFFIWHGKRPSTSQVINMLNSYEQ